MWKLRLPLARCYLKREQSQKWILETLWWLTPLMSSCPLCWKVEDETCRMLGLEEKVWRAPGQQWVRPLGVLGYPDQPWPWSP